MDNIIGSVFFEFVGAFIKWSFYAIVNLIRGKKIIGFLEIWSGKKDSEHSEIIANGVSNIYLGIISVVLLILLLIKVT